VRTPEGAAVVRQISEADWRVLRQLEPVARDRFCERVLAEVVGRATAAGEGSHARYSAVYRLIERRDRELAGAFDGLRRSTAFLQLARMRSLGLVTDAEFARFGPETRQAVELFSGNFPA
jgi:hypothetical protein